MNWLDRLERRFGFIAIPNLMLIVIAGQAAATLLAMARPTLPLLLWLDPVAVSAGQWWRLLTWVIVPSTSPLSVFFAIFWFWFLWIIGQSLESAWGHFRATVYILLGVILPPVGAMLVHHLFGLNMTLTGFYFSASLQLAFAALAPEFTIYLMLLLPVKMRWLAWAMGAWFLWRVVNAGLHWGPSGFWATALEIGFGLGNYLLFFLPAGWQAARTRRQVAAGRRVFEEAKVEAHAVEARACERCGAGPEADLRLCTCERCGEDGKNWCEAHLPAHLAALEAGGEEAAEEGPPPRPRPRPRVPKKQGAAKAAKTKRKG